MIPVKSEKEIVIMRQVCAIVAATHRHIQAYIKSGITTRELDEIAESFILSQDAKPNFKNYNGFPCSACISVNDVVVHGIPSSKIVLKDGDIVSVDLGATKYGFHGDAARTYPVGQISSARQKLIDVAKQSFFEGIRHARAGRRVGDISAAIQGYVEANGFSVVRQMIGHGIGKKLHEDPPIPNFGTSGTGPILKNGYTLAIEPMINAGTFKIKIDSDGWTCRTQDGKDSAHYENTILITNDEPEILTI